jgi:lysozyme
MNAAGKRVAVTLLTLSAAGFFGWKGHEGFTSAPVIPVTADVPTIGYGSTRYEDGTRVKMSDPPITRQRAEQLARNLMSGDEELFRRSLPGVKLFQEEYDLYLNFVGQYGIGAWRSSSMRTELIAGNHAEACHRLLGYRYMTSSAPVKGWEPYQFKDGKPVRWRFDCSTPGNKVCRGVWTRQLERHAQCMAVQR